MPYGTEPFTDRYGDYKQPTIVDYDQSNKLIINSLSTEDSLNQHKKDMEDILKEILECNPFHAGDRYISFVYSNEGKLAWNINKINELKADSNWLFNLRKYLNKAKNNFILKKKTL